MIGEAGLERSDGDGLSAAAGHADFTALTAVHVADFFANEGVDFRSYEPSRSTNEDYLSKVRMKNSVGDWRSQCLE